MSNTQPARDVTTSSSVMASETGGHVLNPIAPFAVQSGEGMALETPTGDTVTIKAATS